MRLVQLQHPATGRRVALVESESLILLPAKYPTLYDLVWSCLLNNTEIEKTVGNSRSSESIAYQEVYSGGDSWKLLPSFDHPGDPMRCMVSGTGLTHKTSAENRASMHRKLREDEPISDSMKIYLWGEEGGKPAPGEIGVQPEWFYKGNGSILRGHMDPLEIPSYALDGGEEPEIAGIYVIDPDGNPVRIGLTIGNEFSDHIMEQQNYLYLAPSKLRQCAIGPELAIGADFTDISGSVSIDRDGTNLWTKEIRTGVNNITHSLANLEHHHFKYAQHRIPGQVHIHFFGAFGLSFSEGIRLEGGDSITITMAGFGRPLRNIVARKTDPAQQMKIRAMR